MISGNMLKMLAPIVLAVGSLSAPVPLHAVCPPEGWNRESLQTLKASGFAVPDADDRVSLARELTACLGDPDPAVRDGIAYAALTHWMRADELDDDALRGLRDELYAVLDEPDGEGFAHPFAALVLSEVARTDRISPWMTSAEREAMVAKATRYLESVRDYRGFDDGQGWRHGVAHGADWLMQLSINPALESRLHDRILVAVASQVVPQARHAYVHGEPGRLARPVLFIAGRGLRSGPEWKAWFATLNERLGDPALAYADSGWLALRHDLSAFLMSLYVEADGSDNPGTQALKPEILEALKAVP